LRAEAEAVTNVRECLNLAAHTVSLFKIEVTYIQSAQGILDKQLNSMGGYKVAKLVVDKTGKDIVLDRNRIRTTSVVKRSQLDLQWVGKK
jgi:hypothetical protein